MKKLLIGVLVLISTLCKGYTIIKPFKGEFKDTIQLELPGVQLQLHKVQINPEVQTSSGTKVQQVTHYQGTKCAFSFFENQEMGIILTDTGNYIIGEKADTKELIFFNDRELGIPSYICTTRQVPGIESTTLLSTSNKCINWYWETDYDLYTARGSTQQVNFFIQGIWNQVQMLYLQDSIHINLKTLFIWDTQDPYTGPSTSNYLDQFNGYRTSYNGDLAHLIGLNGLGGIAWVNTICAPVIYRTGYSGIFNVYNNFPTYSWTVDCISHEMGHNLGSNHTHDCVWNNNGTRIDDCGTHAGAATVGLCGPDIPDPTQGGTLMSYCHLRTVGKNLSLGFGNQPRTLVLNTIANSSCLGTTCSCTPPVLTSIQGLDSVQKGQVNVNYQINSIIGSTYSWVLPPQCTGFSTSNTINISFNQMYSGGNICVLVTNSCGTSQMCKLNTINYTNEPLNINEVLNKKKLKIRFFDLLGREYNTRLLNYLLINEN